jgi:membrane protease YdiL (CAAX protease family)
MEYNNASFKHLLIWEAFYFLQFVGLEFFFRGFMVHALKKHFGFYSVFVMMVPYCMIHFGKPLPEAFGAILAGIILGILSLKSNLIWLGVLLHFSVALAMDCFSLMHR